jgi:hypothetical protein
MSAPTHAMKKPKTAGASSLPDGHGSWASLTAVHSVQVIVAGCLTAGDYKPNRMPNMPTAKCNMINTMTNSSTRWIARVATDDQSSVGFTPLSWISTARLAGVGVGAGCHVVHARSDVVEGLAATKRGPCSTVAIKDNQGLVFIEVSISGPP